MSSTSAGQRHEPSEELAPFVADLEFADVPDAAVGLVERVFVDTVGVTIPGTAEAAGEIVNRTATAAGSGGPSTLFCRGTNATVGDAAFVNATAGHALDFDDVSEGMNGHPSVSMVAPLLALGEAEGATGEDLIAAFVAGFETQCYLAAPIVPDHYEAGWHATSTFGTFGAAAAAVHLLGADEPACRTALNVAASMPAGVKGNLGTMTKPMHPGQAARSGVTAALLAVEGFSASPTAIGGRHGFYDLYSPVSPDWNAQYDLGERWAIVEDGVHVKKFPCCYATHSSIEAATRLADEHDLGPDDVEAVRVVAFPGAGDALKYADPETGLEGKFSMEYTVACAIARDRVGLAAFEDERIDDPSVQRVRERVDFQVDESLPYNAFSTTVTVETTDGETHECALETPPGTHDDPLSDSELAVKFAMCARRVLSDGDADGLYGALADLRNVESVRGVVEFL